MGLAEVSNTLWRERELLEMLLFKLEEEQLLLSAGKARWLARATREVEVVLEEIRKTELRRAVEVDGLAAELGMPPAPSLSALAEAVEEPWRGILLEHRKAFLTATNEITALAQTNRDLLAAGYQASYETLLALGATENDIYTATGAAASSSPGHPRLVDGAL